MLITFTNIHIIFELGGKECSKIWFYIEKEKDKYLRNCVNNPRSAELELNDVADKSRPILVQLGMCASNHLF